MLKISDYSFYFYLEEKLFNYSDLIQEILLRENGKSNLYYRGWPSKKPHHHGTFNELLRISKNNRKKEDFEKKLKTYFLDAEHGFLHGFFCGFIDFLLSDIKLDTLANEEESKLYHKKTLSLFLHDFAREEPNHDFFCKEYFSELDQAVFDHSNPKKINFLVDADRIELLRYNDYKDWVDFTKLNNSKIKLIKYFYDNFRNLYDIFFKIVDQPLIFHSLENYKLIKEKPIKSYPINYGKNYKYKVNEKILYSVYDGVFIDLCDNIWAKKLCGVIPVCHKDIKPYDSNGDSNACRDHVSIRDPISTDQWLFITSINPLRKQLPKEEETFMDMKIYFLNVHTLKKILNIRNQFYSRLLFFK
jgi:hypothetical protein